MGETTVEGGITGENVEKIKVPLPNPELGKNVSPEPPAERELETKRSGIENPQPVSEGGLSEGARAAINHLRASGITDQQIVEFLMKSNDDIAKFNNMQPGELKAIFGKWNDRWIKTFDGLYKIEDRRNTHAMGPYWYAAVLTSDDAVEKLARTATPPYDAGAIRSNVDELLAKAEKGLKHEGYNMNTGGMIGNFIKEEEPIDTATKEIVSTLDNFIKKAKDSTPDALVEAAKLKLGLAKEITSRGRNAGIIYSLPHASTEIIEDAKSQLMSTKEGKLVWAWFTDSMADYMKKRYGVF